MGETSLFIRTDNRFPRIDQQLLRQRIPYSAFASILSSALGQEANIRRSDRLPQRR